jgi:hypothetical protein
MNVRELIEKRKEALAKKPKTEEDAQKLLGKIKEKQTMSDKEMGEIVFGEYKEYVDKIGKCDMSGDTMRFVFRFKGDETLYGIDTWVYDTRVMLAFAGEVVPYKNAEIAVRFRSAGEKEKDGVNVSSLIKNKSETEEKLNSVLNKAEYSF